MIQLKKKRLDLGSLFNSYLEECARLSRINSVSTHYGDWYGDWYDEWYGGDEYGYGGNYLHDYDCNGDLVVYGKKSKKKISKGSTKRGVRGGSKKNKCVPLYSDNGNTNGTLKTSVVFDDTYYNEDEVSIYFYPDLNDLDNRKVFFNLKEFGDYLDELGIYISSYETTQILNRSISYCCVDPCYEGCNGEPWLISDSSVSGMLWSAGLVDSNGDYCSSGVNFKDDLPF